MERICGATVNAIYRSNRSRITIRRRLEHRNSVGEVEYEWIDVCETWAEINDNVVTIRYQPELLPAMRIVHGGTEFEIIRIVRDPARACNAGHGRFVELHVSIAKSAFNADLSLTESGGHRRLCPTSPGDEQQSCRAFPGPAVNTSIKDNEP
jgi:head-tail adaptor